MDEKGEFDSREFRSALGAFATGVTIVTAIGADGSRVGVTANSFNSVSLDPPMILWSLAKTSRSLAAFEQAPYWAVHILAAHQDGLSNHFAKSGIDKFADLDVELGAGDVPLLREYASRLQCKTAFMYEGGDHVIFVGEVLKFDRRDVAPLIFHGGKYALAARKTDPAVLSGNSPRDSDISYGEDFLGYLLWRAAQHFQSRVIVHLEAHGLNPDSFMILAMLLHHDARTMGQLASGLPQPGAADVLAFARNPDEAGICDHGGDATGGRNSSDHEGPRSHPVDSCRVEGHRSRYAGATRAHRGPGVQAFDSPLHRADRYRSAPSMANRNTRLTVRRPSAAPTCRF
jgi:3-hydroxy-9,10-secoandrosta-1,3,5(10)-triene-9,17-dione monooxygenase reductase component